MLSVHLTGRKSAAQRSRDLFAALANGPDAEPASVRPDRTPRRPAAAETSPPAVPVHLSVVPAEPAPEPVAATVSAPETPAQRIKRLQAEAQALAKQEVVGFERQISDLAAAARLIAEGGDAYPVGAREIARRLAEDLPRQAGVLEALLRKV